MSSDDGDWLAMSLRPGAVPEASDEQVNVWPADAGKIVLKRPAAARDKSKLNPVSWHIRIPPRKCGIVMKSA